MAMVHQTRTGRRVSNHRRLAGTPSFALLIICCVGVTLLGHHASGAIRVEAYRGEPFGIGRVVVDGLGSNSASAANDDRFAIVADENRILYPVAGSRPIRQLLRDVLGISTPGQAEFYFMFRGDRPFDATLYAPDPIPIRVSPIADGDEFRDLVDDWWRATTRRYEGALRSAEYPIVLENYLTTTWARRLGREMPEPRSNLLRQHEAGGTWLPQLAANEAFQTHVERDILLGRYSHTPPVDLALPAPKPSEPLILPIPPAGIEVESIASHVPHECFYLRFGNFRNYLWFRDFLRHWQGDLGNMLVKRSIDRRASDRLQQQLGIGETKLSRIMGPTVIRDVAIIGFDAYLRDGAAMGILFEANNSALLENNLRTQREESRAAARDGTEESITIAGHEVSFITSPDGRLRTYYAVDGDYHLVATSRRLVERFFDAAANHNSLAAAPDFLLARSAMPLKRDDTVFLYASAPFFENLASPRYRIEVARRVRSLGEMRILSLARLAAIAEGVDAASIDELIEAELLPPNFAERVDGTALVQTDHGFRDSERGFPGWFVPVADVEVDAVTRAEADEYLSLQEAIRAEVGQFVPISFALRRSESPEEGLDLISADFRLAPYSQTRLAAWAERFGPPETLQLAPIEGDILSVQAAWDALGETVHVFGGLRDAQPPFVVRDGQAQPAGPIWQAIRGYVGTWPRLFFFDRFLDRPARYDDDGIAQNGGIFGQFWQRRLDDFFLFSLQRDILLEVGPQLEMVEGDRPAQVRLRIADLSDKQMETAVSALGYSQTRATSASAARFMNSLITQLHVPPEDGRRVAEELVVGTFSCPLGGEYELVEIDENRTLWASTATAPENRFFLTTIPADYQMPLVAWFRGLSLDVARLDDALLVHADLEMVHQEIAPPEEPTQGGLKLPTLGSLWQTLRGGPSEDELPSPENGDGAGNEP